MKTIITIRQWGKRLLPVVLVGACLVPPVQADRTSRQGYLGVSVETLSRDERKDMKISNGVLVTEVVQRSPAEKAGIQEDDVLLVFNGKKLWDSEDLTRLVRKTKPKTDAMVTLLRDGVKKDITVKIGTLRNSFAFSTGPNVVWSTGSDVYMGVRLQELNEDLAGYFGRKEDEGALVLSVDEDSPAEEAGIKAGDVVIKIDNEEIWRPEDVTDVLADHEQGDKVNVTVIRQKQTQVIPVELDEHRGIMNLDGSMFRTSRNMYYNNLDRIQELSKDVLVKQKKQLARQKEDLERRLKEQVFRMKDRLERHTEEIKTIVTVV